MRTKSFNTPDVQAILSGRKTMFREVAKMQPGEGEYYEEIVHNEFAYISIGGMSGPYIGRFQQGNIIAVKESWCYVMLDHAPDLLEGMDSQIVYKASVHPDWMEYAKEKYGYKWHSPVTMPREAHRIFLEVVSVKVERLQDISRIGAINEIGKTFESTSNSTCYIANKIRYNNPVSAFQALHLDQWQRNEWVFVYEFRRVEKP